MKLCNLLLCSGALATLPALTAASAAWFCAAAPAAAQDPHQKAYDEFDSRFKQLLAVNDSAGMADLVRKSPEVAVRYADTLCQLLALGSTDALEKQIAALRVAWKSAMDTRFVEKVYEYHSLLDGRTRNDRARLTKAYDEALRRHLANVTGDKSGPGFDAAADEFSALAEAFGQVGDTLNVGRCWVVVAACYDDGLRGKSANFYKACAANAKAVAAYEEIGMAGPDMSVLRTRYEFLKTSGYDQAEPDPNAPQPGQPVAIPDAPPIEVGLAFESVADPDQYGRPNFFGDSVYQTWPYVLLKRGVPAKLDTQPESGLTLEFLGGVQFKVHGAKSEQREATTASGNVDVVEALVKDQHGERPWALATRIGTPTDTYQGRQVYFAPTDDYMYLFYSGAASMVGTLGETPLRILDDNLDGVYGSAPTYGSNWGLAPDTYQPNLDGLVIGKSGQAIPWSQHAQVGERWYRLDPVAGGSSLKATPVELQTGTVRVEFKGEFPAWLVLRGTGTLAESYFDVCQNGPKPASLPVGEYELFAGLIQKGKKLQMMKCLVLGRPDMKRWKVEAGQETVVQLGAPLRFEFDVVRNGDTGVVKGSSVRVLGVAGESYDRFWNCAPEPSVSGRKAGTKKGGKPEEMPKVVGDLNEQKDDGTPRWTFGDVWRPLDLPVELKRGGDAIELQMSEKKHKLLGVPIESDWK